MLRNCSTSTVAPVPAAAALDEGEWPLRDVTTMLKETQELG